MPGGVPAGFVFEYHHLVVEENIQPSILLREALLLEIAAL